MLIIPKLHYYQLTFPICIFIKHVNNPLDPGKPPDRNIPNRPLDIEIPNRLSDSDQ